jgi:hypothetical protein
VELRTERDRHVLSYQDRTKCGMDGMEGEDDRMRG